MNAVKITLLIALLSACGHLKKTDDFAMKLYVFDCGNSKIKDISLFSPGVDQNKSKNLVMSCYLIEHPKGLLMWDTGLADSLISKPGGIKVRNGAFTLMVKKTLSSQLKELKINPKEIKFMAFSHMHPDHTGNAGLFPNSTVLVQNSEFAAAFGPNPSHYSFNKKTYDMLKQSNFKKLKGDYDVFGDGRVVIKHAKGHTPGHQVLFIDLPETGPIVLSGDLYHFQKNRTYRRVPSFNFDKELTLQSMDRIEKFISKKQATLWIQHDPEQREDIRLAPEFYQ